MSLEVSRNDANRARNTELALTLRSHRRSLRQLKAVTNLLAKNEPLSTLVTFDDDAENTPPGGDDDDQSYTLKSRIDSVSIPLPVLTHHVDATSIAKPNGPSAIAFEPGNGPPGHGLPAHDEQASQPLPSALSTARSTSVTHATTTSQQPALNRDTTGMLPVDNTLASAPQNVNIEPLRVAAPRPRQEVESAGRTQHILAGQHSQKPVQVAQVQEGARSPWRVDKDRTNRSEDPAGLRTRPIAAQQLQAQMDASSPSSTGGAYSTATPLLAQDSPDTSPDSEASEQPMEEGLPPPKDARVSATEEPGKEEQDPTLVPHKTAATAQAREYAPTPDAQLRWEAREAVARSAEEAEATPGLVVQTILPRSHEIKSPAQGMGHETETSRLGKDAGSTVKAKEAPEVELHPREEINRITVGPAKPTGLTVDTSQSRQGQLNSRAGDDAQSRTTPARWERPSSKFARPSPQHLMTGLSSLATPFPTEISRPIAQAPPGAESRTAKTLEMAEWQAKVDEWMPLRGAADDPNRDYLEPLFRHQLYDSPRTSSFNLHDLVSSAVKVMSTADHFTQLQERLDFKILRSIYTLQNTNKWTLRQMEKCDEPEQPVTHHDHMMAEVKWMRKDFRAERKMKRSVCAWLAARCADWVHSDAEMRRQMQVKTRIPASNAPVDAEEPEPELEHSGESAAEDDAMPWTPDSFPRLVIVPPELSGTVTSLQEAGKLREALQSLPVARSSAVVKTAPSQQPIRPVSKFVQGKVLPRQQRPKQKRSRYVYADDAEILDAMAPAKRRRLDRDLPPEDQEIALFHPDNKPIRDRLHANNAFRPPSEFVMPSTKFYEFRNGSQWIWEDDQKLRRLAKEYSFNWSLISDELTLPASFKSSAERRTPWECFERWVELEQLPTEMKKTLYFKTWYQRLEQSQQAAERRYQVHIAALQAQNRANSPGAVPPRRKTTPTRVEKRKNTRHLWLVDAMRKLARKREGTNLKHAEAIRAAAVRRSHAEPVQPPTRAMLTPQEFSKRRHERDVQQQQHLREMRQRNIDDTKRAMAVRAAQQHQHGGPVAYQQRPGSSSNLQLSPTHKPPHHQQPGMPGHLPPQQSRVPLAMPTRNGHLAAPHMNVPNIPQAPMRPNGMNNQHIHRMAQANAQAQSAYAGQQAPYVPPQPTNMASPGRGGVGHPQHVQHNQALLANMQQQQAQGSGTHPMSNGHHQMASAPNMPPPPAPPGHAQKLTPGHVPALPMILGPLRSKYPHATEDQIAAMATDILRNQSQNSNHARQSAMNAAAGIGGAPQQQQQPQPSVNAHQSYGTNQTAFQTNSHLHNGAPTYPANPDGTNPPPSSAGVRSASPQHYANTLRQRQNHQMRIQQQSPPAGGPAHVNNTHSPRLAHASPNMTPASPTLAFSVPHTTPQHQLPSALHQQQQRAASRSATPQTQPQTQRVGSSAAGVPSPRLSANSTGTAGAPSAPNALQASPQGLQTGAVAR